MPGLEQLVAVLAPYLARYMARSAFRISSSGLTSPPSPVAMPALACTEMFWPPIANRSDEMAVDAAPSPAIASSL